MAPRAPWTDARTAERPRHSRSHRRGASVHHGAVRLGVVFICLAGAASASAQQPPPDPAASAPGAQANPPSPTPGTTEAPSTSSEAPSPADVPRRSVPDYDGRGPEPTTAGDVL